MLKLRQVFMIENKNACVLTQAFWCVGIAVSKRLTFGNPRAAPAFRRHYRTWK